MNELAKIKQRILIANKRTSLINKLAHQNITEKQYDMVKLWRSKVAGLITSAVGVSAYFFGLLQDQASSLMGIGMLIGIVMVGCGLGLFVSSEMKEVG